MSPAISCKIKHIAFRHLSTYSLPFHVFSRFLFIFVLECYSKYSCYKTSTYVFKSTYFASCIMQKKHRHQFLAIKIWHCVNYVCLCELFGFFVRALFALLDLFWICVLLYTFSTFILYSLSTFLSFRLNISLNNLLSCTVENRTWMKFILK